MILPSRASQALPLVPPGKSSQSKRCSVGVSRIAWAVQVRGTLRSAG